MKKIKINYKKVIDEMLAIDEFSFCDLLMDNFSIDSLKKTFPEYLTGQKITKDLYYDAIVHLTKIIYLRNEDAYNIIARIAKRNNNYIRRTDYLEYSEEEIRAEIEKEKIVSEHGEGITPAMLLFYFYSQNIFQSEKIDIIKRLYVDYLQKIKDGADTSVTEDIENIWEHFQPQEDNIQHAMRFLAFYLNDEYEIANKDNERTLQNKISDVFKAEIVDNQYFKVKKGLLYYFYNYYRDIINAKDDAEYIHKILLRNLRELSNYRQSVIEFLNEKHKILEENNKLKSQNLKYKRELKKIEKKIAGYKKADNTELIKENQNLLKENNKLKSDIEKLQEYINILEEEEKFNETLDDNIQVSDETESYEKEAEKYFADKFTMKDVVVVGGRWNSQQKKKLMAFVDKVSGQVSFIKAEETLRRIPRIKNADLVIFDTSYNSHHYYYKIKKEASDILHITGFSQLEFLE